MFLHLINQCRLLTVVIKHYSYTKLFHVSHINYIRQTLSKHAVGKYAKFSEEAVDLGSNNSNNKNFFGIESDEGVIIVEPLKNTDEQFSKHLHYIKEKSKEKFYRASFGVIRQDFDNKLDVHGQYGNIDYQFPYKSTEYCEVSVKQHELNTEIFNVLYNKSEGDSNSKLGLEELHDSDLQNLTTRDESQLESYEGMKNIRENTDLNYIDKCFFGDVTEKESSNKNSIKNKNLEELSYLDQNFFAENLDRRNNMDDGLDFFQNNVRSKDVNFISKEEILNTNTVWDIDDKNFSSASNVGHIPMNKTVENFKYHNDHSQIGNSIDFGVKNKTKERTSIDLNINNSRGIEIASSKDFGAHFSENDVGKVLNRNPKFSKFVQNQSELTERVVSQPNILNPKTESKYELDKDAICPNTIKSPVTLRPFSEKNINTEKLFDTDPIATAQEFVTKVRKEHQVDNQTVNKVSVRAATEEKTDSKGFRILTNQVPDLSQFTRDEILSLLKDNILYTDDNLLILNKPYSLVLHDSKTTQSACLSLFLEDLAKDMDCNNADPKLYTIHRLDKETTGCLLLARNEIMANYLKSLFAQRKIIKKYWILTSRVPDPLQGVIDIPISEGCIHNKIRMVLHPEIPKDIPYRNHSKSGKRAVTMYKVLSMSGNAALVEATPETGIKHQIRVHFGFGLACPILGDHKYSHLDKMAPQKLPSDLLQKLYVRQSKVRHIPMHIHAHSITIPGYQEGRDLYVSAPLPEHMRANLKRLGFKKKNKLKL